ncbi:unnamed protein product [Phaeothamnion confervicola]
MAVAEIPLDPDGAKVGVEIRVVGNDHGEKLSILPGILSRVDREAPEYGSSGYNDFNTFYCAAASNTSSGSSGSPVLTASGVAVALNCGAAKKAASAFYLPLHRVKRALGCLQRGEKVLRGTLQTIFKHTAFDEVRRLGLTAADEAAVRTTAPAETGLLVVDATVPEGPGDGVLAPGDVLLRLNGVTTTAFLPLAEALDSSVGQEITLAVRRGGEELELALTVRDLDEITPAEFLQVSAGVVHPLSYQQARNYNLPCRGVYVAQVGYMLGRAGINLHCLIDSIGPTPTPDLDAFERAYRGYPDGARVALSYTVLGDRHRSRTAIITVDRRWFSCSRYRRCDETGLWNPVPALPPLPPPPPSPVAPTPFGYGDGGADGAAITGEVAAAVVIAEGFPMAAGLKEMAVSDAASTTTEAETEADFEAEVGAADGGAVSATDSSNASSGGDNSVSFADRIRASLAIVSFDIPYQVDGISCRSYVGAGVVVDAEAGLMVVDRSTVPMALGDALITFGATLEVPGEVLFIHPVHNFAVLGFDVALVRAASIELATAPLSPRPLAAGTPLDFWGLTATASPVFQRSVVTKTERLKFKDPDPPQYTARNMEVVFFDRVASCVGGIFCGSGDDNAPAGVAAFYFSFTAPEGDERKEVFRGVPSHYILQTLQDGYRAAAATGADHGVDAEPSNARAGWKPPRVQYVPAQLTQTELSKARAGMGLKARWADQIRARKQAHVLTVRRTMASVARRAAAAAGPAPAATIRADGAAAAGMAGTAAVGCDGAASAAPIPVANGLETGDVILSVDDKLVTTFSDLEDAARHCVADPAAAAISAAGEGATAATLVGSLPMTVLRRQKEVQVATPVMNLPPLGTDRVVLWSGLMLQAPHLSVLELGFLPPAVAAAGGSGVYCSRWSYGSPAHKHSLRATNFITEVNGQPTPTLDRFVEIVRAIGDKEDVRLQMCDLNAKSKVHTLKTDLHYWPTACLVRVGGGVWGRRGAGGPSARWELQEIEHKSAAPAATAGEAVTAVEVAGAAAADAHAEGTPRSSENGGVSCGGAGGDGAGESGNGTVGGVMAA